MTQETPKPPAVLILDADPSHAAIVAGLCEREGLAHEIVADFDALREKLRDEVEIIVLDLILPGVDGIEVMRFLAQQLAPPSLIVASAIEARILAAAARLAVAKGLTVRAALPKPVDENDFRDALNARYHGRAETGRAPIVVSDAQELRRALAADELTVYYQPKIDIETLQLVSVEALVRWKHPHFGLLAPSAFVELAEQSGLIGPLTDAVVRKSLAAANVWRENEIDVKVAINISSASLANLRLPDRLEELVEEHGLTPCQIILEITESWVTKNMVDALDILTRLRMKGFQLSIDDFGTGYSNMLKLKQIPFSEIKLDQSIIRGAIDDPDARTILESSIGLGQKLGLHLVAEGVESQEDWDLISELGCNEGQGYFIARPMTGGALPDWLKRWNSMLGV